MRIITAREQAEMLLPWRRTAMYEDGFDPTPHEGGWMHVSPYEMEPGTVLEPGGGSSPFGTKSLAPGHHDNLWVDTSGAMNGWADEIRRGMGDPKAKLHYYEVEPSEDPEPHPHGYELGSSTPSARIIRRVHTGGGS